MIRMAGLVRNNSDMMLCEVLGYRSYSRLMEDGFSGNISQRRFEIVLEDYFKQINEASMADVLLNMLGRAVEFAKTKAIKALGTFASFLKKIIQAILKFKEKHPVIFWMLVCIVIMLISSVLSSAAHAEVKSPSGKTMSADHINAIVGALEDISRAAPDPASNTVFKIGDFQKALIDARDNPQHILDLSKQGFFQDAYKTAADMLHKNAETFKQSGDTSGVADYVGRLVGIGKSMIIR